MIARTHITAVATAVVLAALAGAPAAVGGAHPAQVPPQQYEATMLRSQALNILYGLGRPAGMTDAEYRAELIRGAAMNERYGLPVALAADEIAVVYGTGRVTTPTSTPATPVAAPTDGFDWIDAATGAAFAAGIALLGATGALFLRRAHVLHPRH